jgi:hypothetical protein
LHFPGAAAAGIFPHEDKKIKIATQFSQIIIAALFCAALIGNQKAGWQKSGLKNHGFAKSGKVNPQSKP